MNRVTRGFHGRRRDVAGAEGRLPPGQYVTDDFPVLSAGPTPRTPLDQRSLSIDGAITPRTWTWTWEPVPGPAVGRARRNVRLGALRRRVHDQPACPGRPRRPGLGRVRLRRPAASTRARRPRPGCLSRTRTSGRAPNGPVGCWCSTMTCPGSGRPSDTTNTETYGASSGTAATDLAALQRRHAVTDETPQVRTLTLGVPDWPGHQAGPAPSTSGSPPMTDTRPSGSTR